MKGHFKISCQLFQFALNKEVWHGILATIKLVGVPAWVKLLLRFYGQAHTVAKMY